MGEITTALITAAISIIVAVSGLIVSRINDLKRKKDIDDLKAIINDNGNYFINCPACGHKIYLKDAEIKKE